MNLSPFVPQVERERITRALAANGCHGVEWSPDDRVHYSHPSLSSGSTSVASEIRGVVEGFGFSTPAAGMVGATSFVQVDFSRRRAEDEFDIEPSDLSEAQMRIMRWMANGWTAYSHDGKASINGESRGAVSTLRALQRLRLIVQIQPCVWEPTVFGRRLSSVI